jgi:thioesterase domain-containing protein
VLLDSFPPDPSIHPSRHRPLRRRLKDALGVATTGVRGAPGLDQYWRFYRLTEVLHRRYRTAPYSGAALVVVADSPERDLRAGWEGHLTGPWRVVEVEGDHLSMIREPFVGQLAKVLDEALWGVTAPAPAT